jgi:hypothetical protein
MDHFFDEAARILASPISRREALSRLGGLIAGGVLATIGVSTAEAQAVCSPPCFGDKIQCCPGVRRSFCALATDVCCGNNTCNPPQTCCTGTTGTKFCVNPGQTCCGNTFCTAGQTCCPGNGFPFCIALAPDQRCCGSTTCLADYVCCSGTQTCCLQCNGQGNCTGSPT